MKMVTPEQIRAARALLRLEQRELAARAHVSVATLRRLESEHGMSAVTPSTFAQVRAALEEAGVEFIYGGVRHLKKRSPEEVAERLRSIREAVDEFNRKYPVVNPDFSEDDLYDENGLPA
ncbi:helix-turn-helix domain-containing protein [Azospirillum sp.]|uniref:helix-turn-helix domain-containing protein n=1 Tax=Azospirillum sp. TaxID=34012 RepID=UPI003D708979